MSTPAQIRTRLNRTRRRRAKHAGRPLPAPTRDMGQYPEFIARWLTGMSSAVQEAARALCLVAHAFAAPHTRNDYTLKA